MTAGAARGGAMSVFVRTRAKVAGTMRDVLVEIHHLDAFHGGEAPCALLDDFTVWAAPAATPLERLEPDDEDEVMSAAEEILEEVVR